MNQNKKETEMILGIPDWSVWSAYLFSFLITLVCMVYGIYNWNNDGITEEELKKEKEWKEADNRMEETLTNGEDE